MRARFVVFGICLWALIAVSGAANAQAIDPAFEADIAKLMDLTGAADMGEQMGALFSRQIMDVARQLRPDLPSRAMDITNEVVQAKLGSTLRGKNGLLAQVLPLYAKHFTHEDIRALLAFYQTDVGRKAVKAMPALLQEAVQVGQAWGAKMFPEIQAELEKRFRAEGFIK